VVAGHRLCLLVAYIVRLKDTPCCEKNDPILFCARGCVSTGMTWSWKIHLPIPPRLHNLTSNIWRPDPRPHHCRLGWTPAWLDSPPPPPTPPPPFLPFLADSWWAGPILILGLLPASRDCWAGQWNNHSVFSLHCW
jgi:hypothetical protein